MAGKKKSDFPFSIPRQLGFFFLQLKLLKAVSAVRKMGRKRREKQ